MKIIHIEICHRINTGPSTGIVPWSLAASSTRWSRLYAYALGGTSSRRLEQRIREDLGFRSLSGGACPNHWTLNAFRARHGCAINDSFTQVVEMARGDGS